MNLDISKNWFYDLSLENISNIYIWDNLNVFFFDNGLNSKEVFIWENTNVEYFLFWKVENDFFLNFHQLKNKSDLNLRSIFLSNKVNNFKNKINSEVKSDFCKTDILINWIIWNNWYLYLDSSIKVDDGYKKNECKLIQKNTFLGEKWSFKWLPQLFINTDDIIASHSCSVSKIEDEYLYYLKSRLIDEKEAKILLIESIFKKSFFYLFQYNNKKYEEVFDDFKKSL